MPDDSYVRNEFHDTRIENLIQAHVINMSPLRPPKPMEVPLPPEPWSDREQLLEELRHHLSEDSRSPVLVTGPAGAGKSALAAKLAQELRDRFPDGQLYIDLEFEDLFTGTRSALLRLGQPKEQLADSFGGLLAHFRSATRGRSILVVVDGAVDAAEGLHLEPASPSSALVVFALQSSSAAATVAHHELGDLARADAARLLVDMSGAIDPRSAGDLVAHYGTRPGTVRRLAGLIRSRRLSAESSADIVRSLIDFPTPDLLEATYRTLSESASWLYRLLSVLPGSEFEGSVIDVFATPVSSSREVFDELVNAQLVTETRAGWFLIEPSVSRDARERAEQESVPVELATAMRATLRWYRKRAQLADRAVMGERLRRAPVPSDVDCPDFASPAEASDWLRVNHTTLYAAMNMAVLHDWNEEAWAIAEAMWAFFNNVPYPEEAERCYLTGTEATTEPLDRARMLLLLGRVQLDLGKYSQAEAALLEARGLAEEHGDPELVESSISQLGKAEYWQGRFREAIPLFEKAFESAEDAGRARAAALQLTSIGRSHRELGDLDLAASYLESARERFAEIGDGRHVLLVSGDLAVLRVARGESGAIEEADRRIGSMREAGLARHEGETQERLALLLDGDERRRRLEAALKAYERVSSVEARRVRRLLR